MGELGNSFLIHLVADVLVSAFVFLVGYLWGKLRERNRQRGKNIEEYDFYPFTINRDNFPEFSIKDFRLGIHYFLKNRDYNAARQLIFIGEQNNVSAQLEKTELKEYEKLFAQYDGKKIVDDSNEYLENYHRIVRLIGKTFQDMGIEILLHNLMNPTRSIECLENTCTGRHLHDGTTSLIIDLKKRRLLNEDKLNYELNIGSRKFKCTTMPIIRKEYGIVGAICINIDVNYVTDHVVKTKESIEEFFKHYCQTDMKLEENILSKDEYQKALKGKRYWTENVM